LATSSPRAPWLWSRIARSINIVHWHPKWCNKSTKFWFSFPVTVLSSKHKLTKYTPLWKWKSKQDGLAWDAVFGSNGGQTGWILEEHFLNLFLFGGATKKADGKEEDPQQHVWLKPWPCCDKKTKFSITDIVVAYKLLAAPYKTSVCDISIQT